MQVRYSFSRFDCQLFISLFSEAGSDWKVSDSLIPAIINSKSIVFCGAGISTNCGIPDYRSDKRLYQKSNLKDVFDLPCDNSSLPSFWKMHGELYDKCNGALPSTAHWMIACLVQMRKTLRVWNQNVGMIFGKCGLSQPEVVDLHGSDGVIRCVGGHNLPFDANIYQAMSNGDVENLRCSVVHRTTYGRENICRHAVIPGILYYGDNISPRIENFVSLDLTSNVGIVLVLGTSLKIPSYVNLLRTYLHHNPKAKFVIVAKEELTKS